MATYESAVMSAGAALPVTTGHFYVDTIGDSKTIRLNSREYVGTGEWNAVQSKPEIMTDTGSGTSFEASPRGDANVNVGSLIGFKSNPIMKNTTGNLTGAMRCFEGKLECGTSYTGTIDEAFGLEIMHSMYGTNTACFPLSLKNAGGGVGWTGGFALVGSDFASTSGNASTNAGKLKINVGTAASNSLRYIQLFSA